MTDERKGLASCSDLAAMKLCPGKWAACRDIPEQDPGEDAKRGTRIHAGLAGVDVELATDEVECVADCNRLLVETCEQCLGCDLTGLTTIIREKRLWFPRPEFSGQADFIGILTKTIANDHDGIPIQHHAALIVDYKTGRSPVDKADANLQLRGLASVLWANYEVDEVFAAIIQPAVHPPVTIVRYDAVDLAAAVEEVKAIVIEAYKPDAPRNAGEYQCRWCRARATCKAALDYGLVPLAQPSSQSMVLSSDLLERCAVAEKMIESIREAAKRALEADPNSIPGWTLKPGVQCETIVAHDTVYQRCLEHKMDHPKFMQAVEIKKGKLKEALRASTGAKGKALDGILDNVLAGCTESKQTAPSLARKEA